MVTLSFYLLVASHTPAVHANNPTAYLGSLRTVIIGVIPVPNSD